MRRENTYTILVVGRDRVGLNTDTIMVAMMDCDAGEINVVSIPRDTLVNVDWSVKKVNSIYGALGTEGLLDGISDLLGFRVDNYVIVNTYVFQALVDAIGGVYYDVPIYMYYDDPNQDLHISLAPGYQWLSGYQAEQVVRFRQNNDGTGYPDGDLGTDPDPAGFPDGGGQADTLPGEYHKPSPAGGHCYQQYGHRLDRREHRFLRGGISEDRQ